MFIAKSFRNKVSLARFLVPYVTVRASAVAAISHYLPPTLDLYMAQGEPHIETQKV